MLEEELRRYQQALRQPLSQPGMTQPLSNQPMSNQPMSYNPQTTGQPQMVQPIQSNTPRPTQRTYTDFAEQFAMPETSNPYGSYSALQQRRSEAQLPLPTPQAQPQFGGMPSEGGSGVSAIAAGQKYIGKSSYVWGGGRSQKDIENGKFDCSGFVNYAFAQAGVNLGNGNTDTIAKKGTAVSPSQLQPGDIVFFDTYKKNGHVGIYMGNGKFIGSQSNKGVAIEDMNSKYWSSKFNGTVRRV